MLELLTAEQVRELTGWSERHVHRTAKRKCWQFEESRSPSANGKPKYLYALSSLPPQAQMKYASGSLSTPRETTPTTLPLFASAPAPEETPSTVGVPDELKPQAAQRYAAIAPLLDFRKRTNGHRPTIRLSDGRTVSNLNDLTEYLAAQQIPPVSCRTLFRWLDRFDSGGYAALADRARKDKGQSRCFGDENPDASAFLLGKYLNEGLSIQMAWEALVREWPRVGKGQTPSYGTARNFLNAQALSVKTLGREGRRAYYNKRSPFLVRGKVAVMDWWVADHREFDVRSQNSLFAELPWNKAFRIWMTAIFDWGSRKLVGFCFAPTPSSRTISSALRMAILSHGMPRNFYWDNGEDFKKVGRDLEAITLSEEAEALLARDKVNVTNALPFHPRSKPVESWFARWSKRYDPIWRPAYLGNRPTNRPESAELADARHEEFLKGKREKSPLPTDAEFLAGTIQFIEEDNAAPREKLGNRTPDEVMEEAWPARHRTFVNPRLLDILFAERDIRTVTAGGCVQLDNRKYEPTDESLFALDVLQGRQVLIARDPYNLQTAVAADPDTFQFIGEMRIQEFIGQSPNGQITRDQIKAGMRRQRALRKGYGEYLALLQGWASASGWQTEREALLERAGVRTGTDGETPLRGVPGAQRVRLPRPRVRALPQPAFVSDAVAEDSGSFANLLGAGVKAEE
jgi:hypothetical protein